MVARADAEALVESWARDATDRRGDGAGFIGMLEEFEFGFVAWLCQPEGQRAAPGSGARRVIDRETGEISTWGAIPAPMVADQYRRHRQRYPPGSPTVEPAATIRRLARPPLSMDTRVQLMLGHDRRLRIAYGAKGDQELNHHPVVRDFLAAHATGDVSRGAERHAEMVVVSDILHSHDAATGTPTSVELARKLFAHVVMFEKNRVRTGAMYDLGSKSLSCFSCVELFVHIGLYPPAALTDTFAPVSNLVLARERPDLPAELLPFRHGGTFTLPAWPEGRPAVHAGNSRHDPAAPLPQAALEMCRRYAQCLRTGSEPGLVHRVEDFSFRPQGDDVCGELAADFGRRLGALTFPAGNENNYEAVLVGDERGRLFVLDQAGEWFLGGSDDEALVTLFQGREQRRVRDDGTW